MYLAHLDFWSILFLFYITGKGFSVQLLLLSTDEKIN